MLSASSDRSRHINLALQTGLSETCSTVSARGHSSSLGVNIMSKDDASEDERTPEHLRIRRHVRTVLRRLLDVHDFNARRSCASGPETFAEQEPPVASRKWMATFLGTDILQAIPFAVYATDATGRVNFYNEAAANLWGRRPVLGHDRWCGSWRLYLPDGTPLPHDHCPMAVAIQEDREVRGVTAIAERPDGTRVHFRPFPTPIHDTNDKLIGAVNVLIEIETT
jgi:PAS domain-containing protein